MNKQVIEPFFVFGIIWVPIGIIGLAVSLIGAMYIPMAEPFLVIGIVWLIFGLVYRNRWYKPKDKQGES